jgi:hypothetical protein
LLLLRVWEGVVAFVVLLSSLVCFLEKKRTESKKKAQKPTCDPKPTARRATGKLGRSPFFAFCCWVGFFVVPF